MPDPNAIHHGQTVAQFMKDYWHLILAIVGFVVSTLIVLKGKIPYLESKMNDAFETLKSIEAENFLKKESIYDANNQVKFQTNNMCINMRDECHGQQKVFQDNFCRKLDTMGVEIKSIVNDADLKREETRHEITTMNKHLIELMTQMKTILARDRREETAEMVQLVVGQVLRQNGQIKK